MERPLELFFKRVKDAYAMYFYSLRKWYYPIFIYRLILLIPILLFVFIIQIPILVLEGTRSAILSALIVNRNLTNINSIEDKEATKKIRLFELRFENYLYGAFETFPLMAIFALSIAIFVVQGVSNLIYLFLTWSPNLLFPKFIN
jgi:hypothetical protein